MHLNNDRGIQKYSIQSNQPLDSEVYHHLKCECIVSESIPFKWTFYQADGLIFHSQPYHWYEGWMAACGNRLIPTLYTSKPFYQPRIPSVHFPWCSGLLFWDFPVLQDWPKWPHYPYIAISVPPLTTYPLPVRLYFLYIRHAITPVNTKQQSPSFPPSSSELQSLRAQCSSSSPHSESSTCWQT